MKVGVVFPQTEIGSDPAIISQFATTAESLGYDPVSYTLLTLPTTPYV